MKKVSIDKTGYLRNHTRRSYLSCPRKMQLINDTNPPSYCCHIDCAWFNMHEKGTTEYYGGEIPGKVFCGEVQIAEIVEPPVDALKGKE